MGESWEEAAARELMEEAGLIGKNYRFLAATNDIFDSGKHYISIWLECDWSSGEVTLSEPDIMNEFQWCNFKTLPSPLFEPCWQNLRLTKPDLFK
jgi:8-oxo-dGTP diphosphatase